MDDSLGQYRLLDKIASGGLGDVYRARDIRHGRTVALKVVSSSVAADPRLRTQLMAEARQAGIVTHPNVAALFDAGEDQGTLYLAFEFVPGETLRTVMGGRPLHPRRALDLCIQVADALADIHRHGMVHQDIRPGNAALTQTGRVKLLDTGVARWTGSGRVRHAAASDATAISRAHVQSVVAYMSPEQALGGRMDQRTDIFSLGVILYEMLTGRSPFDGPTAAASIVEIMGTTPPPPSTVNRGVPAALDAIVGKALAKSLDQRYQHAADLAADLRSVGAVLEAAAARAAAAHPVAARPVVARPAPAAGPRRSNRVKWAIAAVLLLAALILMRYGGDGLRRWRQWWSDAPTPVIGSNTAPLASPRLRR